MQTSIGISLKQATLVTREITGRITNSLIIHLGSHPIRKGSMKHLPEFGKLSSWKKDSSLAGCPLIHISQVSLLLCRLCHPYFSRGVLLSYPFFLPGGSVGLQTLFSSHLMFFCLLSVYSYNFNYHLYPTNVHKYIFILNIFPYLPHISICQILYVNISFNPHTNPIK